MKLTDEVCAAALPKDRPYKLTDGGGLYLLVQPNGSRYWRMKYYFAQKEKLLSLGVYPSVSLADARHKRDEAQKQINNFTDPVAARRLEKWTASRRSLNTFEIIAREWHENRKGRWSSRHAACVMSRLEENVFPYIGSRAIGEIDAPELLERVVRRIEDRGALEVASRVKQICGQVFRYGIATGHCKSDPSIYLTNALKHRKPGHYAALDIKDMPEFLRALDHNDARLYARTRRAIRLLMLCFTRTSELINAPWSEFDLENGIWEIPPERMKMGKAHIVPLSRQAIDILKEQRAETADLNTPWVFPSQVRPRQSMSNNTILFAIGRMGYKGRMTGHGFRALAMSAIKERLGYRHEVVDRQLAHAPANKVDRAYDRAQFLDERIQMMQDWADYLDAIADKGEVFTKAKAQPLPAALDPSVEAFVAFLKQWRQDAA